MNKIIIIILLLIANVVCAKGLEKKVLFTMNKNEVLSWGEYVSNNRMIGYKYTCMITDTVNNTYTLIWNGVRKPGNYYYEYIDVEDYDNSVYTYYESQKWYIKNKQGLFGPYEWVLMDGESLLQFRFGEKDGHYVHDYDGKIYNVAEGRWHFSSPNGVHEAKLSQDYRQLLLDGETYILPFPVDGEIKPFSCLRLYVLNDGRCYFITVVDNQWRFLRIVPKEQVMFISYEDWLNDLYEEDWTGFNMRFIDKDLRIGYYANEASMGAYDANFGRYEESLEKWIIAYEFSIQDVAGKHQLYADWQQDYVLIDGRKYGKSCPIEAFYDKTQNAFVWVAIEGSQIVRYSFTL